MRACGDSAWILPLKAGTKDAERGSFADAWWADEGSGLFGVVRGFSAEPTLSRTDLAAVSARSVNAAIQGEWQSAADRGEAALERAFRAAHARLAGGPPRALTESAGQARCAGSAEAAVWARAGGVAWSAHAGTCRIYLSAGDGWQAITQDHSLAIERPELAGLPLSDRIATRRLGIDPFPGPSIQRFSEVPRAVLLVTTDMALALGPRPALPTCEPEALSRAAGALTSLVPAEAAWALLVINDVG